MWSTSASATWRWIPAAMRRSSAPSWAARSSTDGGRGHEQRRHERDAVHPRRHGARPSGPRARLGQGRVRDTEGEARDGVEHVGREHPDGDHWREEEEAERRGRRVVAQDLRRPAIVAASARPRMSQALTLAISGPARYRTAMGTSWRAFEVLRAAPLRPKRRCGRSASAVQYPHAAYDRAVKTPDTLRGGHDAPDAAAPGRPAMSAGLAALLDDVAALARAAAASVDDVAAGASRASMKAGGVIVDDAAVTPRYVQGFRPERELPMIRRIAVGSLRNKLLFILPAALLLSELLPWLLTPILMIGGTYLCYEGAEKLWEASDRTGARTTGRRR